MNPNDTGDRDRPAASEGLPHASLFVTRILIDAANEGAGSISLTPGRETPVSFRVRGKNVLKPDYVSLPLADMVSRLKILSGVHVAESEIPQDGWFEEPLKGSLWTIVAAFLPGASGEI